MSNPALCRGHSNAPGARHARVRGELSWTVVPMLGEAASHSTAASMMEGLAARAAVRSWAVVHRWQLASREAHAARGQNRPQPRRIWSRRRFCDGGRWPRFHCFRETCASLRRRGPRVGTQCPRVCARYLANPRQVVRLSLRSARAHSTQYRAEQPRHDRFWTACRTLRSAHRPSVRRSVAR